MSARDLGNWGLACLIVGAFFAWWLAILGAVLMVCSAFARASGRE